MKTIHFVSLLLLASSAFSQTNNNLTANGYAIHGYVNGVRLDSIDAEYAEVNSSAFTARIFFNSGQIEKAKDDRTITNKSGDPIKFNKTASNAFIFNFLYYNGWEFVSLLNPGEILVRKRS